MEKQTWQNLKNLALLILDAYGERLFFYLHTIIKNMSPDSFCTACFLIVGICILFFPENT